MYTNQEKREIERVLTAFKPYIEQADYVEIVWSNKKQCYVALFIDTTRIRLRAPMRFCLPKRSAKGSIPKSATTSFLKTTASIKFGRCPL